MSLREVVSRDEWLVALRQFLTTQKELIGACDALSAERLARRRQITFEHYVSAWPLHGGGAGSNR
jgi:predicted dithiol-disulfide oxidoreductase (DUF899 family)